MNVSIKWRIFNFLAGLLLGAFAGLLIWVAIWSVSSDKNTSKQLILLPALIGGLMGYFVPNLCKGIFWIVLRGLLGIDY